MTSIDELERLHALRAANALSEEEYASEKAKVIARSNIQIDADATDAHQTRFTGQTYAIAIVVTVIGVLASLAIYLYAQQNPSAPSVNRQNGSDAVVKPDERSVSLTPAKGISQPLNTNDWRLARSTEATRSQSTVPDSDFLDYPAPLMIGTFKKARENYGYPSDIARAQKEGVVFAGHYAVATAGCGTYCTLAFAIDGKTGEVIAMPFGGEEYGDGVIQYSALSTLVKGFWNADDKGECDYAAYVLKGNIFKRIKVSLSRMACPEGLANNQIEGSSG